MPQTISKTGRLSGQVSERLPAYLDPLARHPLIDQWGGIQLPDREKLDLPLSCGSMATSHSLAGIDYSIWGNQITVLDSFEVSGLPGSIGSLGTGSTYTHTVYMQWLDPCTRWYNDRW